MLFFSTYEFLAILIATVLAAIYGAKEGKARGYKNRPLLGTFFCGYAQGALVASLGVYLIVAAFSLYAATGPGGFSATLEGLALGLIIAPIVGGITSLIPAPIAAFIAYNFGAQKRVEEEIARNMVAEAPNAENSPPK